MWALIITVALNLQQYTLFNTPDGQPVSMRTTTYKVAVGQFATKATCEAYANLSPAPYLQADGTFPASFTFPGGLTAEIALTPNVVGCERL